MKTELLKIAQDLEQGSITENEAQTLLLGLLGISHSYYQVVHDVRKLGMQEVTAGLPTLESAKKAMEHNKQWFDNMYIMARINCG
jgi:hypothetical protein